LQKAARFAASVRARSAVAEEPRPVRRPGGVVPVRKADHEDRGAENQATRGEFADPPGTEQKARVDRAAHRPEMVENRLKNMPLSSVPVIIENPTI
jgi:hypothetical protein